MGRLSPDSAPPHPCQHHQGAHGGHPAGHSQRQRQCARHCLGGLRVQVQARGPEAAPLPHLAVPPPPGLAHVVRGFPGEALGGETLDGEALGGEAPQTQDEVRESVLGRGPWEPARAPPQGSVGAQGRASLPASQSASPRADKAGMASSRAASIRGAFTQTRANRQDCDPRPGRQPLGGSVTCLGPLVLPMTKPGLAPFHPGPRGQDTGEAPRRASRRQEQEGPTPRGTGPQESPTQES